MKIVLIVLALLLVLDLGISIKEDDEDEVGCVAPERLSIMRSERVCLRKRHQNHRERAAKIFPFLSSNWTFARGCDERLPCFLPAQDCMCCKQVRRSVLGAE